MSKKYIKNGMVAVLFSPGFGAGWSTWNKEHPELVFDSFIADLLEKNDPDYLEKIQAYCALQYPDCYLGGLEDLTVQWLPVGTKFTVEEYDGSESIQVLDQVDWFVA